ncbi:MAG: AzlC family ABC transporter permease [Firmicutes bacterium]|nr:AzlC family ABC transporter permease [Bacillota bacterium]
MKNTFKLGVKDGIPICLGYFSVSFGVGILAIKSGLSALIAVIISATNLTSAGQVAGIGVIAVGGSFIEMILTQLLINCRYSLMALSLSQNLSKSFTLPHRMLAAFGITDEIFGVAASKKEPLTPTYMYGLISISTIGWVAGTFLGAVCGEILPPILTASLGILLYGMFIAIIIPPIRQSKANLTVILLAAFISCMIYYFASWISGGFSIIISAVVAAGIMAYVAPVKEEE